MPEMKSDSNEEIKVALKPIEKAVKVYSGRPGCGCGCGCQGKYWPASDKAPTASDNKFVCYDVSDQRTYTMYYGGTNGKR
jgi:hypothetical protein